MGDSKVDVVQIIGGGGREEHNEAEGPTGHSGEIHQAPQPI